MRLRHTLLLLLGVGITLPLVLFWFWLERTMLNKEIAEASTRHQVIARNLGASLERYHTEVKSGFQLLSDNIGSEQGPSNLNAILKGLNFANMSLVDLRSGFVDWQAGRSGPKITAPFPAQMLNVLRVYADGPDPRFSPVMRGSDGTPSLFMVKRLGTRLAIGELKTDYIVTLAKSASFGHRGQAAILDHEGNVLAHPLEPWVKGRRNMTNVLAVKRALKGEQGVEVFRSPAFQTDMIAGFAPVAGTGWGVMVPQPLADLQVRAQETRNLVFLMVMFFVLLSCGLALAASTLLSEPLQALNRAMRKLQAGDTGVRIKTSKHPLAPLEVREGQEAFNALAAGLEHLAAKSPVSGSPEEAEIPARAQPQVPGAPGESANPASQLMHV